MNRRPLSITLIGWFLIVTSVWSVFTFWSAFNNPIVGRMLAQSQLPPSVHMAFAAFSLVLNLVVGVALLKRQNWSRYVYVGAGAIGLLIGLFTSPFKSLLLVSVIFLAVISFFLFRKPASTWFSGAAE